MRTYEPDNSLKRGYWSIFEEIYADIRINRWLTYQLFKRDVLAAYKQTFIGILWTLIIPLANVGLFLILNQAGIFSIGQINVPYAIYALSGMLYWYIFSSGLISSSNSLVKAGAMIAKINFSKKSLVIASIGQTILSFFIQIILLVGLFIFYSFKPHIAILVTPLFAIPVLLLTLGLGFIISLLNGIFRDAGTILSFFLSFMMFLTPILYTKSESGLLATITKYNPLYYFISVPRAVILGNEIPRWGGFCVSTVVSILVFVLCLAVFHLAEARIAERV